LFTNVPFFAIISYVEKQKKGRRFTMKLNNMIYQLQKLAPTKLAADWDNPGLQIGDRHKQIKKIMVVVDVTDAVVDAAIQNKVDLIISHHPLIFNPIKQVTLDNFIQRRIFKLLQNDICLYVMHTNFDVTHMARLAGGEEYLDLAGMETLSSIGYNDEYSNIPFGYGVVGYLKANVSTVMGLAEEIKEKFNLDSVRVFGNKMNEVRKIAICPGAGSGHIKDCLDYECDVLITGDVSHHTGIDAYAQGLTIIDAGHYGIEKIFVPFMKKYLKDIDKNNEFEILNFVEKEPFYTV
jgi:dinuclear metal center YbgI/SA1388 family protein